MYSGSNLSQLYMHLEAFYFKMYFFLKLQQHTYIIIINFITFVWEKSTTEYWRKHFNNASNKIITYVQLHRQKHGFEVMGLN